MKAVLTPDPVTVHRDFHALHRTVQLTGSPIWTVGWWWRLRLRRQCRRLVGHCWHADGMIDWFCCCCPAEIDGMPAHRCKLCVTAGAANAESKAQSLPAAPADPPFPRFAARTRRA